MRNVLGEETNCPGGSCPGEMSEGEMSRGGCSGGSRKSIKHTGLPANNDAHDVSNNEQTLARCGFDKHGLILIIILRNLNKNLLS